MKPCKRFSGAGLTGGATQPLNIQTQSDKVTASSDLAALLLNAMDQLTPSQRSENMSRIRSQDTRPELAVRRFLHKCGFRYRLHRKDLVGSPDIVLPKHRVVLFVHGCFWHRHVGCARATTPKTNVQFWQDKFAKTVDRDHRAETALNAQGWDVQVIWECRTKSDDSLRDALAPILELRPDQREGVN